MSTSREFIAGAVPTLVTFVVLSVFGEAALFNQLTGDPGLLQTAEQAEERALLQMLDL